MKKYEECKYYLPCGWCDKNNEKCIFEQVCEAPKNVEDTKNQVKTKEYDFSNVLNTRCVEHVWYCTGVDTSGWTYKCTNCGQTKKEYYNQDTMCTPVQLDPELSDISISKTEDFPPHLKGTCTSGYINTNKCPEREVDSILTTNVTTSATTKAQGFINQVNAGNLPEIGDSDLGIQYINETPKKRKK